MSIDIDNFDFGFTAVDEDELEAVQQLTATAASQEATASDYEDKDEQFV